jgi:hypothetical protein
MNFDIRSVDRLTSDVRELDLILSRRTRVGATNQLDTTGVATPNQSTTHVKQVPLHPTHCPLTRGLIQFQLQNGRYRTRNTGRWSLETSVIKVKVKQSYHRPEQAQRVDRGRALRFRDLGARRGCGKHHAPAALPLGKTRYSLYSRLGGPQDRSGRVRKISPPPGLDLRTVQPVVSRYTDWANAATGNLLNTTCKT